MSETKEQVIELEATRGTGTSSPEGEKERESHFVEKGYASGTDGNLESGSVDGISVAHRNYLVSRHGTADLNPLPTMDPADPLNWPDWKKNVNLFLVAFHAMMTTFTAASIIPAFETFSIDFGTTITKASYLTSIQILILGIAPLFWKPISNRYGRRPIWLISTFCSMICNIGNAESNSYASQVVTRLLVAFFISPAIAISSAVVTETFFANERGQKMGIWTLMVTLGPPTGPFIMGFVAFHSGGWKWIYWILAITNGMQFILYFFLSPETLYVRNQKLSPEKASQSPFRRQYLNFGAITAAPMTASSFLTPIHLFAYPNVLLPTFAYTVIFNFSSVLLTVEIPQIFTPKFRFNAQQIGLQFIGMIIGSVLGEQAGGYGSDWWMRRSASSPSCRGPEYRIWLFYPGFLLVIIGLVVFCVQTESLKSYNVTPIVGIGISAFGNQMLTTVLVTYAVDCHHEHAASIGVFINLVRSTWGFIGPFFFPAMFTTLGLDGSAGLMVGLMIVFALFPVMFIQWKGRGIRERSGNELEQIRTIMR